VLLPCQDACGAAPTAVPAGSKWWHAPLSARGAWGAHHLLLLAATAQRGVLGILWLLRSAEEVRPMSPMSHAAA
jgi:hypothetical protein